jgi:hypothetical protein
MTALRDAPTEAGVNRLLVPVLVGAALLTSIVSSLGAPLIPSIATA